MTNQQIETLIQRAEKEASSGSFLGARVAGTISVLLSPTVLMSGAGIVAGVLVGSGWLITVALWLDAKDAQRNFKQNRARAVWQEIERSGALGLGDSARVQELCGAIARVYETDPQGEVLPLSQAIRLVLVWKQQTQRLDLVSRHTAGLGSLRATLLEKQTMLRELGDENLGLQRTLASLDANINPLERSCTSLRGSCARLEALVLSADAAARRRQLHREVGELTAGFSPSLGTGDALELADEHLDLERQITREIETFLQLERETDAHLRDV